MAQSLIEIAIVDNKLKYAQERKAAIERQWPTTATTDIFTNAADFIDAVDMGNKFYDVIITDVYMPKRGDDPAEEGSPEDGAIRIKEWLSHKRETDSDFRYVQLRWISRFSDVSPFIHKHITREGFSWLQYISHNEKSSFYYTDFIMMVDVAIQMATPGLRDATATSDFQTVSPTMTSVLQRAKQIADKDVSVLVTGENGTGKEVLARFIHQNSKRSPKKFIAVNCGAVSESLLESELFGHVKGAFTGATANRVGWFEAANGGSLLLDEIGEMKQSMQVKLLRVIQEREFRPVGSNLDAPTRKSDFRLICATNKDLLEEVKGGKFREDLYYRIKGVEFHIPPLRERKEDIAPLVKWFLPTLTQFHNLGYVSITDEAAALLLAHNWPGNVRELQNVLETAAVFAGLNGQIGVIHLPDHLQKASVETEPLSPMTRLEQSRYDALVASGFNISKAARRIGITKQALHKFIHETRSGTFAHPILNRLYEEGYAAIRARAESTQAIAASKLPPASSVREEADF